MNAEWRTTTGSELLDVYLWLEDATGTKVVYPGTSLPNGMPYHQMAAWPKPRTYPQWKEAEVGKDLLTHGEKYQVCVAVRKRTAPHPRSSVPLYRPTGSELSIHRAIPAATSQRQEPHQRVREVEQSPRGQAVELAVPEA